MVVTDIMSLFLEAFYAVLYASSVGSFPKPLSAAEEKECIEKMRGGDRAARSRLIEHNLRLVAHVIKKYYASGAEQDDLISIGTIGLIKAVDSFDSAKGTRISTYAARCIENEIRMYFRSRVKTNAEVYIGDPIESDREGNELTLLDILYSDGNGVLEDLVLSCEKSELAGAIQMSLTAREREVIIRRYGLSGGIGSTQQQVAEKLNISRSYISRIEKKALEKLKKQLADRSVGEI